MYSWSPTRWDLLLLSIFPLLAYVYVALKSPDRPKRRPSAQCHQRHDQPEAPALKRLWPVEENDGNYTLDIVAIHGLDTRSPHTWQTFRNGRDAKDGVVNWLKDEDMLHHDFPRARIFTYDWLSSSLHDVAHDYLEGHATALLNKLSQRDDPSRHLILIASSFGGLLLAKAVTVAARAPAYDDLRHSMINMLFLGTPFRRSPAADSATIRIQAARLMGYDASDKLMSYLTKYDGRLLEIVGSFERIIRSPEYNIVCYYETGVSQILKALLPTYIAKRVPWGKMVLVPKNSAYLGGFESRSLNVPHGLMNKFRGPTDANYISVRDGLRGLAKKIEEGDIHTHLRQYYTCDNDRRLTIERLSGLTLPMNDCYINLSIVEHGPGSEQPVLASSTDSAPRNQSSSFSLAARLKVDIPMAVNRVPLSRLFDVCELQNGVAERPHRILIWGRAGIGKTTLCKKIVHDFVYAQLWHTLFDYIFWIPLRELKHQYQRGLDLKSFCLEKFFRVGTNDHHPLRTQLEILFEKRMHRIVFILDGLDEVSYSFNQDEVNGSLLGDLLKCTNVIITSRPHASHLLSGKIDLRLETIGFSPGQVSDYLQHVVERKEHEDATIQEIHSFIKQRPLVESLTRIPIMLDAICYSWSSDLSTSHNKDSFMSMADFYKRIENKLWSGYVERQKGQKRENLRDRVGTKDVEKESNCLQKLAFNGMYDDLIEFDDNYINEADVPAELYRDNLLNMSFLRSSDTLSSGIKENRHFLHLTFQEYFAAQWFVRHWTDRTDIKLPKVQPRNTTGRTINPVAFLQSEKYNSRYNIFWRFVVGLLRFRSDEDVESFFSLLDEEPYDLLGPAHQRLLIQYLNEVDATAKLRNMRSRTICKYYEWIIWEHSIQKSTNLASIEECPESIYIRLLGGTSEMVSIGLLALQHQQIRIFSPATENLGHELISVGGRTAVVLARQPDLSEPVVRKVIALLEHADDDLSKTAASVLQTHGKQGQLPEPAVSKLAALLGDADIKLRLRAVDALATQDQLPEPVVSTLVALLGDAHIRVRLRAVDALAAQDRLPEPVVSKLAALLGDADIGVRLRAVYALAAQDRLPESVVSKLIALLDDRYSDVRSAAAGAFEEKGQLPQPVVDKLVAQLKHENSYIRTGAERILLRQELSNPLADKLAMLLEDQDNNVFAFAASVFLWKKWWQKKLPEPVESRLVAMLEDQDGEVRARAASLLGNVAEQKKLLEPVESKLVALLEDQDGKVRAVAASVLGVIAKQKKLPEPVESKLVALLEDQDSEVRRYAVMALFPPGVQKKLREPVQSRLVAMLKDQDGNVRAVAASILRKIAEQKKLPEPVESKLVALLEDQDSEVRRCVATALFPQGMQKKLPESVESRLVALLEDQDGKVRAVAASVLGEIAKQKKLPEPVESKLVALLEDQDSKVRRCAATALFPQGVQKKLPEPVESRLVAMLEDQDGKVRAKAADILTRQNHLSHPMLSSLASKLDNAQAGSYVRGILRRRTELCSDLPVSNLDLAKSLVRSWMQDSLDGFETYIVMNADGSVLFNLNGTIHTEKGYSSEQLDSLRNTLSEVQKQLKVPVRLTAAQSIGELELGQLEDSVLHDQHG